MSDELAFCEKCRSDVEYAIAEVRMTGTIKGAEYHYIGKEARCLRCHSLIFVPEINDYNLQSSYEVYRNRK